MTMLELTGERVLEKLYENAEVSNKTGRLPNTVEEAATDLQMNFENAIANDDGNLLKSFDKKPVRIQGIEPIIRVFTYVVTHFL